MSLARIAPAAHRSRGASSPRRYHERVTTYDVRPRRQAFTVRALATIDVAIGVVSVLAGLVAFMAPPPSIVREIPIPALIWLWASLLVIGGTSLAFGRLVDRWIFQTSGIAAMIPGAGIYLVVLLRSSALDIGVLCAAGLILLAMLFMARRYLELQAFTAVPRTGDATPLSQRIRHIFAARTPGK